MKTVLLLSALLFIVPLSMYSQSDWPMASRDREQTSWAKDETTLAPPFDMRVIQCPTPVAESFDKYSPYLIYAQEMLYLAIDNTPNWLLPVDPTSGHSPWYGPITGSCCSVGTSPAVTGDVVIQGGQNFAAMLTAFNRTTGAVLWEKPTGSMYGRNPVVDEGRVYYRLETMTCLDAASGDTLWAIPLPGYPNVGSPAVDDMNCYFSYEDTLFAVNKMTGARKWFIAGAGHEGLCVDADQVYFNRDDAVFAADKYTGAIAWKHTIPDKLELAFINGNSIAIDDEHLLYVIWADKDSLGTLTMLNKSTGAFGWTHVFPGEGTFAPTIANDIVYIVNWKTRTLWGLDIETGDVVFNEPSRKYWAQPIVANGTLYVNSPNADSLGYAVVAFTPPVNSVSNLSHPSDMDIEVYPNPLAENGSVRYVLDANANITLDVFNALGQKVMQLYSGYQSHGTHEIILPLSRSGTDLSSGAYTLRMVRNGLAHYYHFTVAR